MAFVGDTPLDPADAPDLAVYARIRKEAAAGPILIERASELLDEIGARLTGSTNLERAMNWAMARLRDDGSVAVRRESWGTFGMGWRQRNVWVRLVEPDTASCIACAAPWSPATPGPVAGPLVVVPGFDDEAGFPPLRGRLRGAIVLFQRAPALPEARPITRPLFVRLDETQLADDGGEASIDSPADDELWRRAGEQAEFLERVGQFFADEGVAAVIVPSEGNESGGATGGTVYADQNYTFGWRSHQPAHAMRVPLVIVALEAYGRLVRLARRTPVRMEVNVDVEWTGDAVEAFNVFAEIQGTDTGVRGEEVFVSAHLDSWAAGTGATDNGAGVLVAMEVMRILNTLHLAPRRTVRIALWTGEEQGMLGSREYVKRHVARVPLADTREDARLPERMRRVVGPIAAKSDHARISAVYTVDGGSGRIRGVGLSGNAALAPIFRAWLAPLRDLGVAAVSLHRGCSGDAFTFHQVGIPAPSFIHDPLEYETRTRHTNHDTYERLLPEDLQQAAAVVATLVYNTARRPALLPRLSAAG